MGVNFRWLVNLGLLILPVAVTLGILIGLESQRQATGAPPLFKPSPTGPPVNNELTESQYCQKSFGITPLTKGQQFTLNPNQWGWTQGQPGSLCMNVSTFNNQTYPTKTTAPEFSVTWQYPQGPESEPVHAYPNIMVDGGVLPIKVGSLSQIGVDLEWTYSVGNLSSTTMDTADFNSVTLNANVAFDMFLDSDQDSSQDTEKAQFEVMIWYMQEGDSAQPLGGNEANAVPVTTKTIDGVEYKLFYSPNAQGQDVLTWVASATTGTFNGDIAPFITDLSGLGVNAPASTDYLGYLAFGSEAYFADNFVTFYVPTLSIDVEST